jgi:hypothetical protein
MSPVLLRPEVREFADEMERELRKHDLKKGDSWKTMDEVVLSYMLTDVWDKLDDLDHENPEQECSELIDLANIAMMLWHRLKGA